MTKNILTVLTVVGLTTTLSPNSWAASGGSYTPAPSPSYTRTSNVQASGGMNPVATEILAVANKNGKGNQFKSAWAQANSDFNKRTGAVTCRSSRAKKLTTENNYGGHIIRCLRPDNQKVTANSKVAYNLFKGWRSNMKHATARICAMAALPLYLPGDKVNILGKRYSAANLKADHQNIIAMCKNSDNW